MLGAKLSKNTFLFLSRQEALRKLAASVGPLHKLASRFVAGETMEEALRVGASLNAAGLEVTFDHLNEDVTSPDETRAEVGAYTRLVEAMDVAALRGNVSVKLSQLGLSLDEALAEENARALVGQASARGRFVRLDMEGSALTEGTLRVFRRLRAAFGINDVGCAVQAYLRRTEADVRSLLRLPARIRLCKGAYLEPPEVAFADKEDVDRNFVALMRLLLDSGTFHGIATHDPKMIDATVEHHQRHAIPKDAFEFQMLYGVRRDLQESLRKEGFGVRVYVPFGAHWYPYFMRRLAERPANVLFVAKALAGK